MHPELGAAGSSGSSTGCMQSGMGRVQQQQVRMHPEREREDQGAAEAGQDASRAGKQGAAAGQVASRRGKQGAAQGHDASGAGGSREKQEGRIRTTREGEAKRSCRTSDQAHGYYPWVHEEGAGNGDPNYR